MAQLLLPFFLIQFRFLATHPAIEIDIVESFDTESSMF